jgi:hypothetical protein
VIPVTSPNCLRDVFRVGLANTVRMIDATNLAAFGTTDSTLRMKWTR